MVAELQNWSDEWLWIWDALDPHENSRMRRIPLQPPHDWFTLDGLPTIEQASKHCQWAASILTDDGWVNVCVMLCVKGEEIGVSFNEGWSYIPLAMIESCDWQAMDPETNLPISP